MGRGALCAVLVLLAIAPAAAAQGGRIAFEVDGDIFTMRIDGSERTRLTNTPGKRVSAQPDWSPDGRQIAFARGTELSSIWIAAADGSAARRLTARSSRFIDYFPDWSPDGVRVAFSRVRFGRAKVTSAIMAVDAAGGRPRRLASLTARHLDLITEPAWSPDGRRILYTRSTLDRTGHFKSSLYVLDVAAGTARRLAEGGGGAWSPDGTRIAFAAARDHNGESCGSDECFWHGELYVMNADGTGATRLTNGRGNEAGPTWSPDGSAIAFTSSRDSPDNFGSYELYLIRADGSCLTRLTNGARDSTGPDWQPGSGGLPASIGCAPAPKAPDGTDVFENGVER